MLGETGVPPEFRWFKAGETWQLTPSPLGLSLRTEVTKVTPGLRVSQVDGSNRSPEKNHAAPWKTRKPYNERILMPHLT